MLQLRSISIDAGGFILEGIDLDIAQGGWATIMGRTGCGKTTVLEAVCGLRAVTAGSIWIDGAPVTHLPPRRRGIGLVPQDGALFAGMRVEAMISLPLRAHGVRRRDRRARTAAMADRLGIAPLLGRTISGLSGGERQRIALGRALIHDPPLLCLDEPLAALDGETHASVMGVLREIRDGRGATVLHVTHDESEAQALAHTIWRMENGALTGPTDDSNHH